MWIKNCWQVAALSTELGSGLLARTISGERLVLFRDSDGRAAALDDRCPHRIYPLSRGRHVEGTVECGYHGMRFGADGLCVRIPGQDTIPARAHVRALPLVERYGWIWVWLGNLADADPALIPDFFHWPEDPQWTTVYGYTHIAANYQLLADNLLDLSHESFVHRETIGNGAVADNPVFAAIENGVVSADRTMPNCEPPPFFVKANFAAGRIDRRHTTYYRPPCAIVVHTSAIPSGETDPGLATERRVMFPISPETLTSSHMFWAVARNYRLDDAELNAFIHANTALTQEQDKAVLEAQQALIGDPRDPQFPVSIRVDAGPTLGRRLHADVLARERERAPVHA